MFIGVFKNTEGKTENYIYFDWRAWHSDTFSPATEIIGLLVFKIKGKNYNERKYYLEDLAKDWQLNFSQYSWSYGELAEIESFFYKNAKRYGLIKEFKENCII